MAIRASVFRRARKKRHFKCYTLAR